MIKRLISEIIATFVTGGLCVLVFDILSWLFRGKYEMDARKKVCFLTVAAMMILSACGNMQQDVANDLNEEEVSEEVTQYSETDITEYAALDTLVENNSSEPTETESSSEEPEYSMEDIEEIFFGEWEVSKLLGFAEIQKDNENYYPDGLDIIGNRILISKDLFSSKGLEKYECYQSEILEPVYEMSKLKYHYLIYHKNEEIKKEPELYSMILNDEYQDLEIRGTCEGIKKSVPPVNIMLCNKKFVILDVAAGTYYLLERVK